MVLDDIFQRVGQWKEEYERGYVVPRLNMAWYSWISVERPPEFQVGLPAAH
jgi:hypothetical protein